MGEEVTAVAQDFLPIDALPRLLDELAPFGEIHGPILSDDDVAVFCRIASAADVLLGYQRTLLPPKTYLLPPPENAPHLHA